MISRVPWEGVCAAIGVQLRGRALPARTRCPLCARESLDIFDDNSGDGQWHHCASCGSAGDMPDLAARVWGVGVKQALERLAEMGVGHADMTPERFDAYAEQRTGRDGLMALWRRARARYPQAHMPAVRAAHCLALDVSPARWLAGPGHFLGAVQASWADEALAATTRNKTVFRGRGWDASDLLAAPFMDMPDRIVAFAFLGRGGAVPGDQCVIQVGRRKEGGLFGAESVAMAGDPPYAIAVDSWPLALQAQVRAFRTSVRPLPLVAWRDDAGGRTRAAWSMLGGKRVTFWAPAGLTASTVRQAIENDGAISLVGPTEYTRDGMNHWMRDNTGEDLTRVVLRDTEPWPTALRKWRETHPSAPDLFAQLEQEGVDLSNVWRRMALGTRDDAEDATALSSAVRRTVVLGPRLKVAEQDDRWYVEQTGGRMSATFRQTTRTDLANATFRVSEAVKDAETGVVYYKGVVRHAGRSVPFLDRMDSVRRDPSGWLAAKMLDTGVGLLQYRKHESVDLHDVSMLFHEPSLVVGPLWKWVEQVRREGGDV